MYSVQKYVLHFYFQNVPVFSVRLEWYAYETHPSWTQLPFGESSSLAPRGLLGVSVHRDPLLCTCWEDQLTAGGRFLCRMLGGHEIQVVNFIREELFCFVLREFSVYSTFLPIPQFPIPSDNETTICWINRNSGDEALLAASLSEVLCLLAW